MAIVHTTKGLLPSEELEIKDHITLEDNARIYATEWFHNGERVRRDVWVSALRPIDTESQQSGM